MQDIEFRMEGCMGFLRRLLIGEEFIRCIPNIPTAGECRWLKEAVADMRAKYRTRAYSYFGRN